MAGKKKDIIEDTVLCEGITLKKSFYDRGENRLLTLLVKGFIVYLLTMGSIGFYLSAFNIEYNAAMCHIVIGIMAVCCALLYYRLLFENLGYFLLLIVFGLLVMVFRVYINSGFYAVVNITVDEAAEYFDIDIRRLYNEQIDNRYVTITCAALFIGIVLDILLNVYISRRMQYLTAIFIVMAANVIPLYMTDEPDIFYSVMLLSGLAMTYVLKSGRHYSPQVSGKRSNRVFENRKKSISYVYDVKAMIQAGIHAAIFTLAVVVAVFAIKPRDGFNVGYTGNKYKELTMAGVSTLLVDGWSGFFNNRDTVGGMDGGRLGDVSTVRLDYQSDLIVQMTPYSYDNIYLKAFVGVNYNPYQNSWTDIEDMKWYDDTLRPEAAALREAYDSGLAGSAKGVMVIRNVGANPSNSYEPYYTESYEPDNKGNYDIVYYPRLIGNTARVAENDYGDMGSFTEADLYVPQENLDVISATVDRLEIDGTDAAAVSEAIKQYFQDNIPYTIRPGKTPANKDFVNYFLDENKKGYCAHYASAAVLMFRYMGIPARYIEGYTIDYYQITEGKLVDGASYADYYDGYSAIGETALVEVNVTDADAHAWVEIYEQGKGWYVVDVTPVGETEEIIDFWEMFNDVMGGSDSPDSSSDGALNGGIHISDEMIRYVCYATVGIILGLLMLYMLVKGVRLLIIYVKYIRSGINDRLIMRYSWFGRRYGRRVKKYRDGINYREQVTMISGETEKSEHIIDILERAGFSAHEISEAEFTEVVEWIKNNRAHRPGK